MKTNSYTIETHAKDNKPVFCLAISCQVCTGVYFFTDMQTLKNRLELEKDSLRQYGIELTYDSDFLYKSSGHYAVIREFLQSDDLQIHNKSGNTYSTKLFPTEQDYENYFLFGVFPEV